MLRSIKSAQRMRRDLHLKVTGTGTAEIDARADYLHASLADNGTGLYTITFLQPFAENPIIQLTSVTAQCVGEIVTTTTSYVQVRFRSIVSNNATDAVFHISIHGTDTANRT